MNYYYKQTIIFRKKRLTVILVRIAMKILCDGCLFFCTKIIYQQSEEGPRYQFGFVLRAQISFNTVLHIQEKMQLYTNEIVRMNAICFVCKTVKIGALLRKEVQAVVVDPYTLLNCIPVVHGKPYDWWLSL